MRALPIICNAQASSSGLSARDSSYRLSEEPCVCRRRAQLLFRWKPNAAYATMAALLGASLCYLNFIVIHANYNMCEAGVGAHRKDHNFEGNENTLEYNKPWTRCGPFLMGVILACFQSQFSNRAGHLRGLGAPLMTLGYLVRCVWN